MGEDPGGQLPQGVQLGRTAVKRLARKTFLPHQRSRVAVVLPCLQVIQRTGANPVALVVDGPQPAFVVKAQAIGTAQARSKRGQGAVRRQLHHPAAPGHRGVHASIASIQGEGPAFFVTNARAIAGSVQGEVQMPVVVFHRTKVEFVVVAGQPEVIAQCVVFVGLAVAINVNQLGQLRPLHHHDRTIFTHQHAQRIMQSRGKSAPGVVFENTHFTVVEAGPHPSLGVDVNATHLGHHPFGRINAFDQEWIDRQQQRGQHHASSSSSLKRRFQTRTSSIHPPKGILWSPPMTMPPLGRAPLA